MAGFIDPQAPDILTEYSRFVGDDFLGKVIFKNFLLNRIGILHDQIHIPRGRHGDVGAQDKSAADARVRIELGSLNVEVKCARINVANRSRGDKNENYQFFGWTRTRDLLKAKEFDLAVAICVGVPGIEESGYWEYLPAKQQALSKRGIEFNATAFPHEAVFLNVCSFFILPRHAIQSNQWRVTFSGTGKSKSPYWYAHAWGYDRVDCLKKWNNALAVLDLSQRETSNRTAVQPCLNP